MFPSPHRGGLRQGVQKLDGSLFSVIGKSSGPQVNANVTSRSFSSLTQPRGSENVSRRGLSHSKFEQVPSSSMRVGRSSNTNLLGRLVTLNASRHLATIGPRVSGATHERQPNNSVTTPSTAATASSPAASLVPRRHFGSVLDTSATYRAENVDSLEVIESDLESLVQKEIDMVSCVSDDMRLEQDSRQYLELSGFSVVQHNDGQVTLRRESDTHRIEVTFSVFADEGELDEDDETSGNNASERNEYDDEEEDDEDDDEEYDDQDERGADHAPFVENNEDGEPRSATNKPLKIEIEKIDTDGGSRGVLHVAGMATQEREFVAHTINTRTHKDSEIAEHTSLRVAFLSPILVHRLYDYLESLGIDDDLASFVATYVLLFESNTSLRILTDFQSMVHKE